LTWTTRRCGQERIRPATGQLTGQVAVGNCPGVWGILDNSETGNNADFCNGCFAPDIYDFNTKTIFKLMETISKTEEYPMTTERLAYSIQEAADMLGVHYFSIYRLVQGGKLKVCRALRGKLLVPRTELLRLLKSE
jgi:excisionase family DNA binding protein